MTRATKAHKARLLNAAYRLLGQRIETADAARQLADEFALSFATGLSVSRASCHIGRSRSRGGTDGGHHLQAPGEHRARASHVRQAQRAHPRTDRHTGAGCVPRHLPPPTWLSDARPAAPCTFSSTTPSIDYGPTSSPTPTKFSFRLEPVR